MVPVIILIALGGLLIATRKKAPEAPEIPEELPPPVEIPFTVDELVQEIGQAQSLPELDAYYNYISELFIRGEVNHVEYMALYRAYEARFYELMGVPE